MKRQKSEVDYSLGHQDHHCGPTSRSDTHYCAHFYLGFGGKPYRHYSCRKVAGPIKPIYWCKLFEKVSK